MTDDSLIDQLRSDADEMADRHGYTAVPRRMREAADRLDAAEQPECEFCGFPVRTVMHYSCEQLAAERGEGGDDR